MLFAPKRKKKKIIKWQIVKPWLSNRKKDPSSSHVLTGEGERSPGQANPATVRCRRRTDQVHGGQTTPVRVVRRADDAHGGSGGGERGNVLFAGKS